MGEHRIWLIRHAESTWNASGRWQGQADPPLSPLGRVQASRLAAALASEGLEVLIASDLARAAETASILGGVLGLAPVAEPGLREIAAGRWQGLTREEIERRDAAALRRFDAGDPAVRAGGGESRLDAAGRARSALRRLLAQHGPRRLALVTHGGVIRSLLPDLALRNAEWRRVAVEALLGDGAER